MDIPRWNTKSMKRYVTLKVGLLSCIGIMVLGLVAYNVKDLVFGTPLTVATTTDGATLASPFLPITGVARHARELLINGRSVAVDRDGNFTDEVVLSPGYNIVEVAFKDQFGKQKIKTYQVVVTPPAAVATTTSSTYQ
jgi:hypothetical protein